MLNDIYGRFIARSYLHFRICYHDTVQGSVMYEGKFKSVAQRGYDNMSDIPLFTVPGRKSPGDAKVTGKRHQRCVKENREK